MRYQFAVIMTLLVMWAMGSGGGPLMADSTNWDIDGSGNWFEENWTAGIPNYSVDAVVSRQDSFAMLPVPMAQIQTPGAEAIDVILGKDPSDNLNNTRYYGGVEITDNGSLTVQEVLRLGASTGISSGMDPGKVDYGEVRVSGNDASLTVCGHAWIGDFGEGLMEVTNDAGVGCDQGISLGHEWVNSLGGMPASKGTLNVNNEADLYTPVITVGEGGQGFLNITTGGKVHCQASTIASNYYGGCRSGGSSVVVSGTNSLWQLSNGVTVGFSASGSLSIQNGGRVVCSAASIGSDTSSGSGTVSISGSNSSWSVTNSVDVDHGSISISGGEVSVGNEIDLASGTSLTLTGGSLDVDVIDTRNSGSPPSTNYQGGQLSVGTYYGELVNKGSTLNPKDYRTYVRYYASDDYFDYDQWSGATLSIDVDGSPASGLYDQLHARDIDLAGDLRLDFTNFIPQAGSVYPFLFHQTGYSISGMCSVETIGLPSGYSVEVDWGAGEFTVMPEPAALVLLVGLALLALPIRRLGGRK